MQKRFRVSLAGFSFLLLFLGILPLAQAAVTLKFYDRAGHALTAAQARATMQASGWDNTDALVQPTTLQVLKGSPLYDVSAGLAFATLSKPAALAINWPTTQGYSLLIVDNGGAGFSGSATVNLTYTAAQDVKRRLDAAINARPDYVMSSGFMDAYDRAGSHLANAKASSSDAVRGKEGQLALDDLAIAQDAMLAEYGIDYSRRHLATRAPMIGVTLDRVNSYAANLDKAKQIAGGYGWVRVVFDPGQTPASYTAVVNAAKARGLKVLGQPIDSYEAKRYSRTAYLARVKQFVDAFPQIDGWEVGNEVNGSWLGTGMGDKIADTAAYVRSKRPDALVMVTLYWQIGTDYPKWSTFNWARANLSAATRANIDVIGLSTYVEDAPMGLAMDQVFNALHAEFPKQKIAFGELDYWLPDTSQAWWAFDAGSPTTTARQDVARQYYAAGLGYSFSLGGGYWWDFAADRASADPSLDMISSVAHAATTAP
jgi:hypothetical protein